MQPDKILRWGIIGLVVAGFLFYTVGLLFALSVFLQWDLTRLLIGAVPLLTLILWWSPMRQTIRSRDTPTPAHVDDLRDRLTDYVSAIMLIEAGIFGMFICLLLVVTIGQGHPDLILLAVAVMVIIVIMAIAGMPSLRAKLAPPDEKQKSKRGR